MTSHSISEQSGFALLECVVAMTLFSVLACLVVSLLGMDLRTWMVHHHRFEQVVRQVDSFSLITHWFEQHIAAINQKDDCHARITLHKGSWSFQSPITHGVDGSDVIMLSCSDTGVGDSIYLFVSQYQGHASWTRGLYMQLKDHKKALLVGGVSSIQAHQCLQEKQKSKAGLPSKQQMHKQESHFDQMQWIRTDGKAEQICQGILISLQFENGNLWNQVVLK